MEEAKIAVAFMSAADKNQEKQSESIDTQRADIEAYANKNEFLVEAYFDNTIFETRDMLNGILGFCKGCKDINYLIVSDSARISRNSREYMYWKSTFKQAGVEIVCAKYEPLERTEKFFQALMEVFAHDDNYMRAEIVKRGMTEQAKKGYSVHRPPLGYIKTGTKGLYQKTVTATALACYFKDTANDKMTPAQLRVAVSKIYHPTKLIKKARLMLLASNPYYAGFISYDGKLYKGLHEPILTPDEQEQLISRLG